MTCQTKTCEKETRGNRRLCNPCFRRLVFLPRHPLYDIWTNMIRRCHYPNHPRYADWGGRGIVVCERWRNDYFAFQEDVGSRPGNDYQLDRIDNEGNYEPGNTQWVLAVDNSAYNKRRIRKDNNSGVSGVTWDKQQERWRVGITVSTRHIYLGTYVSKSMAIKVRKSAEKMFLGMIE